MPYLLADVEKVKHFYWYKLFMYIYVQCDASMYVHTLGKD